MLGSGTSSESAKLRLQRRNEVFSESHQSPIHSMKPSNGTVVRPNAPRFGKHWLGSHSHPALTSDVVIARMQCCGAKPLGFPCHGRLK